MKLLAVVEVRKNNEPYDKYYIPHSKGFVEHDKWWDLLWPLNNHNNLSLEIRVYNGEEQLGWFRMDNPIPSDIFDIIRRVHEIGERAEEKRLAKAVQDG